MDLHKRMREAPYHRWLGVELLHADGGEVEVRMPFREEFLASDDRLSVHGGIISTLADLTACFAMMSSTGKDAPNMNLQVDYLRMVGPDTDLVARGKAVKTGRTVGVADVEIRTTEGRLVAVGRSTLVNNAAPRETLTGRG
ncbi:MAG: PaaI family thioesterase [Chloroflexi bacterium]|nr:PaaI family thioesterase [Chloroflexota bacterium]